MKAIAIQPIRYKDKRIEVGEEFDLDNQTWQKIKDKNLVKLVQFNSEEKKIKTKIEIKTENKGEK